MNSSKSYRSSVDSSEFVSRTQQWCSPRIGSIQNLPRGSCKSRSNWMWLQHYYGTDIVEPIQDLGRLCARIISKDSSLRGTHADLAVNDELVESI